MIAFKGRLSFRQYLPAKPTKYGIKGWMAADSSNGYVVNFSVYLGSVGEIHETKNKCNQCGVALCKERCFADYHSYEHINRLYNS